MKKYRKKLVPGDADRLKTLEFAILYVLSEFTGKKLNANVVLELNEKLFEELTIALSPWTLSKSPATEEQPVPHGSGTNIHDEVKKDIEERKKLGIKKYGEALKAFNDRNPLVDAYQEILDLAVYLRQELEEREYIIDLLYRVTLTTCTVKSEEGYVLDSHAIGDYAEAIELLEKYGKVEVISISGLKRIIAKDKEK